METAGKGWYWLALLAVVVAVGLYVQRRDLGGQYRAYRASDENVRELGQRLEGMKSERESLEKTVKHLDDNPLELEAAIRRGKSLVREGETVYNVTLPDDTAH